MKRLILSAQILGAIIAVLIISSRVSLAEPPNIDPTARASSGDADTLEKMATIRDLIHIGIKDNDALSLITAAQLMRQLQATSITRARKVGPSVGEKLEMSTVFNDSVGGILKRAARLSAGKPILSNLIKEVRAMPKVRPGGTMYIYEVAPKSADEFEITFEPGRRAAIYAESQDENGFLSIVVRDESGNVVCQNNRNRAHVRCAWTPIRKGEFKFRIENALDRQQQYVLVTN